MGTNTGDDAGVYRLNDDTALIQTVDFFTPVVDDPYLYGQIAAANALSDVYAMGGWPLTAMNITCFPTGKLDLGILREILQGGADKIVEAGAVLVGGHTIRDDEPKYGLAVTGIVHPEKVITNAGARPGDLLVLTKPLGIGIITTAIKGGVAPEEAVQEAVRWMTRLNREAAAAMQEVETHACTDITGFGLLGHALEMATASGVALVIDSQQVPVIAGAADLARMGILPGGARANRRFVDVHVTWPAGIPAETQDILCDPQTSGGLLIAVGREDGSVLVEKLSRAGLTYAAVIGEVTAEEAGRLIVR